MKRTVSQRTLGQRVRARRKELDMSMEMLARTVGVKYQTIQDLELGKSRGTKHLLAIARALKVRPEWLEDETGTMKEEGREWNNPPPAHVLAADGQANVIAVGGMEFARLPIHDIQLAAGAGSAEPYEEFEPPLDYHFISLSLLRSLTASPVERVFGVQVRGESMEDTLRDRDWVIVDSLDKRLVREGIFALNNEGEAIVKRVSRHIETKAVTLISDNPKYPQQIIKKPERLSVIGRVIFSIRRH